MLWRHEFNTSGQVPSSAANRSPLTWAAVPVRRNFPLLAAFVCLLGLIAVGVLALLVPAGHERDAAMLHGFMGLDRPGVHFEIKVVAHLGDTLPYACAGLLCIALALARGRGWRALATIFLLVVTGATTQALKHLLSEPRLEHWLSEQIAITSWPSGHSTAAMTLALCAVLVAPPVLRPAAGMLGGAFAVAVGYAVLVLGWHFPSDVLGGFLVAGLWTSLAVAVLHRVEAPEPARRPAWEPLAALGAGAATVVAVVLGARADTVALYTLERPTFVVGAVAIALLALTLVTAVSAASARGAPQAR
jgi:membrane-associated phospholipid phosphatase